MNIQPTITRFMTLPITSMNLRLILISGQSRGSFTGMSCLRILMNLEGTLLSAIVWRIIGSMMSIRML